MGTEGDVIGARFLAFIIDSVLSGIIGTIILVPGFLLGDIGVVIFGLLAFVFYLVYWFLLEGLYGYKPGKYLMGLVVVKSDGSNCTVGASIIRNLLLFVDQLPFAYIIGIVLILITDKKQRVGDLVGNTVVVKRR